MKKLIVLSVAFVGIATGIYGADKPYSGGMDEEFEGESHKSNAIQASPVDTSEGRPLAEPLVVSTPKVIEDPRQPVGSMLNNSMDQINKDLREIVEKSYKGIDDLNKNLIELINALKKDSENLVLEYKPIFQQMGGEGVPSAAKDLSSGFPYPDVAEKFQRIQNEVAQLEGKINKIFTDSKTAISAIDVPVKEHTEGVKTIITQHKQQKDTN